MSQEIEVSSVLFSGEWTQSHGSALTIEYARSRPSSSLLFRFSHDVLSGEFDESWILTSIDFAESPASRSNFFEADSKGFDISHRHSSLRFYASTVDQSVIPRSIDLVGSFTPRSVFFDGHSGAFHISQVHSSSRLDASDFQETGPFQTFHFAISRDFKASDSFVSGVWAQSNARSLTTELIRSFLSASRPFAASLLQFSERFPQSCNPESSEFSPSPPICRQTGAPCASIASISVEVEASYSLLSGFWAQSNARTVTIEFARSILSASRQFDVSLSIHSVKRHQSCIPKSAHFATSLKTPSGLFETPSSGFSLSHGHSSGKFYASAFHSTYYLQPSQSSMSVEISASNSFPSTFPTQSDAPSSTNEYSGSLPVGSRVFVVSLSAISAEFPQSYTPNSVNFTSSLTARSNPIAPLTDDFITSVSFSASHLLSFEESPNPPDLSFGAADGGSAPAIGTPQVGLIAGVVVGLIVAAAIFVAILVCRRSESHTTIQSDGAAELEMTFPTDASDDNDSCDSLGSMDIDPMDEAFESDDKMAFDGIFFTTDSICE
jgi:hypothetical protein